LVNHDFRIACFNEHFFEAFLADNTFNKYFPRLKQYVDNSSKEVLLDYLSGVEGFARDEANPNLRVSDPVHNVASQVARRTRVKWRWTVISSFFSTPAGPDILT
jgi:hypothetical protein